ncbi:MAG: 3-oxoacyl-(acyl-carrier-protein) reductase FabG [Lentisphaerae bacterium ADurb.Bin242]|nr:MAG: 3-oxoacyl-(acyl-carrier-protein) reductase FabG [Lentisphaerae bacterium ADurb.Bin242]
MEQKRAFVIGASRGIGRAIACRLAKDGFDIIAACREPNGPISETERLVRSLGRSFTMAVFDVADRKEAGREIDRIFGMSAPDVIVYNAGIAKDNFFVFMSGDEWDSVMRTNTDGFYNTVQPLMMNMMAQKSGRIVVISSASGQAGQAGQVNYSASKAALIGAAKALAREIGRKNILVNVVAPGFIETDMTRDLPKEKILPMIPLNRAGTAEEVANVVSFLCGPDSLYIHGQVIAVNGGLVI